MNDYEYELIGESIWNTYEDIAYIMVEKSITAMHRAGEFKDDDIPITPRAKYKQRRSLERAEETLKRADRKQIYQDQEDDLDPKTHKISRTGEGGALRRVAPPSKIAGAVVRSKAWVAARLRVPPPLAANDTTHQMAALVSRGGRKNR